MIPQAYRAAAALALPLPASTLVVGRPGTGRAEVAGYLAAQAGLRLVDVPLVSVDDARALRALLSTRRSGQVVSASMDGTHFRAVEMLLKVLEENVVNRVVLRASDPRPTIRSRCLVVRLPMLPPEERTALVMRLDPGLGPVRAAEAASLDPVPTAALEMYRALEKGRSSVLTLFRAVSGEDYPLLLNCARSSDEGAVEVLRRWCVEALTGRWDVFGPGEYAAMGADREVVRRVYDILRDVAVPRSALYLVGRVLMEAGRHA